MEWNTKSGTDFIYIYIPSCSYYKSFYTFVQILIIKIMSKLTLFNDKLALNQINNCWSNTTVVSEEKEGLFVIFATYRNI